METEIAELFLTNFIGNIIKSKMPVNSLENEKIAEVKENYNVMQKSMLIQEKVNEEQPIKIKNEFQKKPQPKRTIIKRPIKPQTSHVNYSSQSQLSATDKLNAIIKDPYVNEIECLGTDHPLMVKKSGQTQKTQVNLSIDEIYELIAEFSQKTRIPIVNGRIKAALNDLIITAVLSETLGPRFIIQKKKPFHELII